MWTQCNAVKDALPHKRYWSNWGAQQRNEHPTTHTHSPTTHILHSQTLLHTRHIPRVLYPTHLGLCVHTCVLGACVSAPGGVLCGGRGWACRPCLGTTSGIPVPGGPAEGLPGPVLPSPSQVSDRLVVPQQSHVLDLLTAREKQTSGSCKTRCTEVFVETHPWVLASNGKEQRARPEELEGNKGKRTVYVRVLYPF